MAKRPGNPVLYQVRGSDAHAQGLEQLMARLRAIGKPINTRTDLARYAIDILAKQHDIALPPAQGRSGRPRKPQAPKV
jgi:hypothetical protein